MDENKLRSLLQSVSDGSVSIAQAVEQIRMLPTMEAVNDYANIDLQRAARNGFPEVIFGQGKTPQQVGNIFDRLAKHHNQVMATRVSPEMASFAMNMIPDLVYQPTAQILYLDREPNRKRKVGIAIVTAGTSDINVAEEAALTAEIIGNQVTRINDVGVAGLHRLMNHLPELRKANVVIVVAGMEGALVSVVGGLLACPIIAVPTSVGYGASFNGLAALLAMLNSCAIGVAVVNIDNGFGAGVIASRINHLAEDKYE